MLPADGVTEFELKLNIPGFIPDNCKEALAVKLEPVRVNVFCVEVLVVVFSNVKVAGSTFKVGVGVGVPQSGVEW